MNIPKELETDPDVFRDDSLTDRERLVWMGKRLDRNSDDFGGDTLGMWLARVLLRVRDRSGKLVPLEANPAQRLYEQKRGCKNIVLKARQMGISTWIAGRFFLKTITQPGTLTVEVAQNQEAAEQIFRIVHRMYSQLPEGLREGALRVSRINSGQITFPEMDSEYRVESAANANAGRGMTIQNLHCSEVARWNGDPAATMASLMAALTPTGELVLESTPNGAYGCFYDEWQRADETGTTRHFFPWWMEPAYSGPPVTSEAWTEEERHLAEIHKLSPQQIGFRRTLSHGFRGMAAQEYAENPDNCFLASGHCVFDLESIAKRLRELPEPIERRQNGQLCIWYPPQPGLTYIVAVDPAGGGADGDYAVAQVIEERMGLQCAELRGHLDPGEIARRSAELATEYNRALLAVERNNHGMAVLACLHYRNDCPPIYEQRGQAGWLTTSLSRPAMIEGVNLALSETPEMFSSARLLTECRTFVRRHDGRVEAGPGAHDDCVMAMAIALAVRGETIPTRR